MDARFLIFFLLFGFNAHAQAPSAQAGATPKQVSTTVAASAEMKSLVEQVIVVLKLDQGLEALNNELSREKGITTDQLREKLGPQSKQILSSDGDINLLKDYIAKTLSADDLKEILRFNSSPTGRRLEISKMYFNQVIREAYHRRRAKVKEILK